MRPRIVSGILGCVLVGSTLASAPRVAQAAIGQADLVLNPETVASVLPHVERLV